MSLSMIISFSALLCCCKYTESQRLRASSKKFVCRRIITNYEFLVQTFEESLVDADSGLKTHINGILFTMKQFDFFYGINLGYRLLQLTNILARTLQSKGLTAVEGEQMPTTLF